MLSVLVLLRSLLTVLYLFISKQIKAAYSDKPQVADYLHASRFGTVRPPHMHAERQSLEGSECFSSEKN
jgi:hypothetical protein